MPGLSSKRSRRIFQSWTGQANVPGGGAALDAMVWARPDPYTVIRRTSTFSADLPVLSLTFEEVAQVPEFSRDLTARFAQEWLRHLPRSRAYRTVMISLDGLGTPLPVSTTAQPPDILFFQSSQEYPFTNMAKRLTLRRWWAARGTDDAPGYWGAFIPAGSYQTEVCQLLDEIQRHLLEDPNGGQTWSSGLWTQDEVLALLNERIANFMVETGIIQQRVTIPIVVGQGAYNLPTDWIEIRRVVLTAGAVSTELPRVDLTELSSWTPGWEDTPGTPTCYMEVPNPSLTIRLNAVPTGTGTLELTGIQLPPLAVAGCLALPLPDEWMVYVKWGVMADLLSKEGEANDVQRAKLCEARYGEGVSLAKLLLGTGR